MAPPPPPPPAATVTAQRVSAASAMEAHGLSPMAHLALGPLLQCTEAATLGLPFEVLKTRQGRFRSEGAITAARNVWINGGGLGAFWSGFTPKMIESASKGMVLLTSKEALLDILHKAGTSPVLAGLLAGAGGGIAQVAVMGPCTLAITNKVVSPNPVSTMALFGSTYARQGVAGFFPGGTALAFRQSSNWALRQGFTEAAREQLKHENGTPLTPVEEVQAGIVGGTLSCINQPFEVARIEAQSRAVGGQPPLSMPAVMRIVVSQSGAAGLFSGLLPRIGLSVWQTCFMVVAPRLVRAFVAEREVEEAVAEAAKEDLEANRG